MVESSSPKKDDDGWYWKGGPSEPPKPSPSGKKGACPGERSGIWWLEEEEMKSEWFRLSFTND